MRTWYWKASTTIWHNPNIPSLHVLYAVSCVFLTVHLDSCSNVSVDDAGSIMFHGRETRRQNLFPKQCCHCLLVLRILQQGENEASQPNLAVFHIQCSFTSEKKKKGKFFGDAQEGMINNTSGLYSTDCAALALISPWRENNPRQWKQLHSLPGTHLHFISNKFAQPPQY